MTSPVKINCKQLRVLRQSENNRIISDILSDKDIPLLKKSCNMFELTRILDDLNLDIHELLQQCEDNIYIKKLTARSISKNSSRQGSKDEAFIINECNRVLNNIGIRVKNLPNQEYFITKGGGIHKNQNILKHGYEKHDQIKSLDAKISGKVKGWLFAKTTFSKGGHQDNVFIEASIFADWVIKHNKPKKIYVIMIDTDLVDKFNKLKKKYHKGNLLVVNHFEFQEYMILNYSDSK